MSLTFFQLTLNYIKQKNYIMSKLRFNMKYGKVILHSFILLTLLLSITAISAADMNDTDTEDILKTTDVKSFANLYSDIASEDSNFTFESDYEFNNGTDSRYIKGITIKKDNFVVNGNNHTIDCKNQARLFYTNGNRIEINNLVIKNAFAGYGSAIVTVSELTLNNVTFINCLGNNATYSGGAVYSQKTVLNINNCKFIDNSGDKGASITSVNSELNIVNSTFISNSSDIIKGHISSDNSRLTVTNCNFLNTTSRYAAAIFSENGGNMEIINSKFKNLHATKTAGAIGIKMITDLTITNCTFENASSSNNGGAIFADINGNEHFYNGMVIIANTKFNDCHSDFGGAILQLGGILGILNSTFTFNEATFEGGAVYTSYADTEITNSTFKSNSLWDEKSYGGACYFDKGIIKLGGNIFKDNIGFEVYPQSMHTMQIWY